MLRVIIFLVSASIALISGIILFNIIANIFHTNHPGAIVIVIIIAVKIGVLCVSFIFLSKAIALVLDKLIQWMGIKVIDEIGDR